MRRSKTNLTRPSTSPSQCATVHEEEVQIPTITRTSYCLVNQPSVPRPREVVPLETPAKLQKRHTFVEATRRKSQKEQIQPRPGTYVEQASENTPAPGPTRTSVLSV
ncbi:hypothetical protein M413DRAFT_30190 [Hebeloma cylindrosporum]|uniref:Uncharacterized protein n=1 Tax=Hebeloma cylindrosporum TaxID=76867 RepID=A0A0C3BNU9_HEBCY|nr:hypothetical protein M413DRAFT_30190 [Hebeloma cylindrosporum h7]